tara:strand:- start:403 stop:546 length:144 start_codon:yes stop_codon:yes gene_type:complete
MANTTTKLSVSIPIPLLKAARAKLKKSKDGLTFSRYVATLIKGDLYP